MARNTDEAFGRSAVKMLGQRASTNHTYFIAFRVERRHKVKLVFVSGIVKIGFYSFQCIGFISIANANSSTSEERQLGSPILTNNPSSVQLWRIMSSKWFHTESSSNCPHNRNRKSLSLSLLRNVWKDDGHVTDISVAGDTQMLQRALVLFNELCHNG